MNKRVALISQSEYARRRGVAKSAVSKAVAEGRISLIDGKIDEDVANIQWAKNSRARADSGGPAAANQGQQGIGQGNDEKTAVGPDSRQSGGQAAGQGGETGYHDFRTRRESAEAERAEMEVAKMAGRLVERESTERSIFDTFRALRDSVFSAPARCAPKLLGMAEIRDIEHVITEELRKAFEGWEARMLERLERKDGA